MLTPESEGRALRMHVFPVCAECSKTNSKQKKKLNNNKYFWVA